MRKATQEEIDALAEVSEQLNLEATVLTREAKKLARAAAELTKEANDFTQTVEALKAA